VDDGENPPSGRIGGREMNSVRCENLMEGTKVVV
jgi:hypothetical protein